MIEKVVYILHNMPKFSSVCKRRTDENATSASFANKMIYNRVSMCNHVYDQ